MCYNIGLNAINPWRLFSWLSFHTSQAGGVFVNAGTVSFAACYIFKNTVQDEVLVLMSTTMPIAPKGCSLTCLFESRMDLLDRTSMYAPL